MTLEEIKSIAENSKESLDQLASDYGRDVKIYLHWSAGHYGQFFNDYHVNIDSDGSYHVTTNDLSEVISHTYHRNSGAIGISLACCAGATSNNLGLEAPTSAQIESMSKLIATLCIALDIPCDKTHVLTHGEAADNEDGITNLHDPYGPKSTVERWDLEFLGTSESPSWNPYATDGSRGGDVLRGKGNWYMRQ